MRSRVFMRRSLLSISILSLLFVAIPAVLFANSSVTPERTAGQTIPTRTPVLSWLPIIANQPTYTPTPTLTPTPTPAATETPDGTASCTPKTTTLPTNAAIETVLAGEINNQRSVNGSLPGYTVNDNLVEAARRHAKDMGTFSDSKLISPHTGSDGTSASTRIQESCYGGNRRTEIVGWGFNSIDQMITWWMNSSVHRGVILKTDIDDYGPAYMNLPGTQYTHYWVVTFGNSSGSRSSEQAEYQCTYVAAEADRGMSVSIMQETPCTE